MISFKDKATQIDDLLDKMAEGIQLDQTRWKRMESAYNAVKEWIAADNSFFNNFDFEVYSQGSVRIGAAIKPLESEEFDLDTVVHVKSASHTLTPSELYNQLRRRLNEHERYQQMLEPKNRCIRLNYAGDFHMDILPGRQESDYDKNKLQVPDRKLGAWATSNPRGYAGWFLEKNSMVRESLLEKAYAMEKLPKDDFTLKKPLQRAVQLIKQYRNVYFQDDSTFATSSIILTTICGQYYNGEASIFTAIDNIIGRINADISRYGYTEHRIKVYNPVNPEEDFTDKWASDPKFYRAFKNFCQHLYQTWQQLKVEQGILTESKLLKGLFGEDSFLRGQRLQAETLEKARNTRALAAERSTGLLIPAGSATAAPIRKNTFFGE